MVGFWDVCSYPLVSHVFFVIVSPQRPVIVSIFVSRLISPSEIMHAVCLSNTALHTKSQSHSIFIKDICFNPVDICEALAYCGSCGNVSVHSLEV